MQATALQRAAVRFRTGAGASAAAARAGVATSGGIDLARLFGVPATPEAVAEVLFTGKRMAPEAAAAPEAAVEV